ncbi:MAG: hypothetical protein HUU55_22410 [Myxococcales bacterium]|nr:hypothetical protein [Myxococcales bacterium]
MGTSVIMQDWITLKGAASTDEIFQPSTDWMDAELYSEVTVLLEVKDMTSGMGIEIQTSPALDERLFQVMTSFAPSGSGISQSIVRFSTASVPLARYVRWRLRHPVGAWRITFRIVLLLKTE